jgi:NAD(P)-dependent dehydrogenase (short-subunit alcohol dehydrogenase family)
LITNSLVTGATAGIGFAIAKTLGATALTATSTVGAEIDIQLRGLLKVVNLLDGGGRTQLRLWVTSDRITGRAGSGHRWLAMLEFGEAKSKSRPA